MTSERNWIHHLQKRYPGIDLRHDTFFDPASRQILTTDMLVEDVHFSWAYFSPQDLGWRSIAINLSDIAATGGRPQWVLVSIGAPAQENLEMLEGIYQGIEACCRQYRCVLVGGDTVRAEKTTVSVTAIGQLPVQSQPGRRHCARPGDILATSGPHGLSRAGLEVLQRNLPGFPTARLAHLRPQPQLRQGQQISEILPRYAMMDSSDGLADAALQLAEASQVDIFLDARRLPIHPELSEIARLAEADPLDWLLYGGEDFQLVVSLPLETLSLFPGLQPVGTVREASLPGNGRAFLQQGHQLILLDEEKTYQHFTPPTPTASIVDEGISQ